MLLHKLRYGNISHIAVKFDEFYSFFLFFLVNLGRKRFFFLNFSFIFELVNGIN